MRNAWSGVWCVVLSSVVACAGPGTSAFSLGDTACPEVPGESAPLAVGTLAGVDATRVLLDSGTGSWPRAGGSGTSFMAHGAGVQLTLNGSYYWNDVEHRAVVVTDAHGAVVRTIPLASPTNGPSRLVPAGDAGVYVLTHCFYTQEIPCSPSSTDTIELIPDAASSARTVVTPEDSVQITSIDAVGSVLIWAEQKASSPFGPFKKRDAITGAIVSLETPSDVVQFGPGALLIAGDQFFAGLYEFGTSRIERRALADGALIDTFHLGIGAVYWLAQDGDLYFAQSIASNWGPPEDSCTPGGLFRIRAADRTITRIDIDASPDRMVIDGDVLYYTHLNQDHHCPEHVLAPSEVPCYRQR